jgi:hypothetical protein
VTETATATETPTATPEPASFDVEVPPYDQGLKDSQFRLALTVRNTGGQEGEFETTLQLREPSGGWQDIDQFGDAIEPGASREFTTAVPTPDRDTASYRLTNTDRSWTMELLEPANYTLTLLDITSDVQIGEQVEATVEITNTGDIEREKRINIGISSEELADSTELTVSLPAGESVTRTVEFGPWQYMGTLTTVYLDGREVEQSIRIGRRELSIGESHTLPNEIQLTSTALELTDSYTYAEDGETQTETSGPESQFAILTVEATNTSTEIQEVSDEFYLYGPEKRYDHHEYIELASEFDGRDLLADETRTGELYYEVPASLTREQLRALWLAQTYTGDIIISWETASA